MKPLRIFFSGVGGQGTLTATRLLAETALENGMEVTAGEIHGMAQRGGVVHSFVLVGGYMSPKISHAEADILLGFEPLETLRALPFLRPGGLALSSDTPIPPLSVSMGKEQYPDIDYIRENVAGCAGKSYFVPCTELAGQAGNVQTANTVLLGAFFAGGFFELDLDVFLKGIQKRLPPKLVDANLKAARLGAEFISSAN
ncbi:Pyruvate/ketoisovalerate oxidoreductase [Desulfonatronospira thiodismutans ASO3-1]|uniref:Pyruvate/ketoisovalerate oxidoreductase n=1 Tax=Desulfonatronospira thiodismutans ASO3-1 TaxID=555779 RepID=D6SSU7_9BACT|nr:MULTISPECIES: indolepyruvate oxidoreductase subunit beta [Desulfonatronospira]EFI33763.1 Pyruvate/ketoisovalerate oxidoreductase [Desulfonatronospira thiodismutans ASO3-1]RQD78694.1 MAG: indolepyruvate ferredoxin oxidoreductase [Desulfonatronospira sp. MSAO_Bac3]